MARHVSKDNLIMADLHGTAWRYAAELGSIREAVTELTELSHGRLDLLAQSAGIDAGSWYAKPSADAIQLLVAGLLITVSGHIDPNDLVRWSREGYDRALARPYSTAGFPDPSHLQLGHQHGGRR